MAKTNPLKNPADIKFVYGELVDPGPDDIASDLRTRDREGIDQIERVIQGLEQPADAEKDRAAMMKALGPAAPVRTADASLRVEPGFVVGKSVVDGRARDKVTGRALYSTNVYASGMLYTKVLRSPFPHAMVTSIDTSKAEAYPGVAAVITNKDVPQTSQPALVEEARFVGDSVAAVAAESEAIAEEALSLIEVVYEQLPFVLDVRDALRPDAPLSRVGSEDNNARNPQFSYERGDIDEGWAEAEVTVEIEIETSYEQHVSMEPHNTVTWWEGDVLTLNSGTQWAHGAANAIARDLRMPASKVRVYAGDTGGGWGDKTGRHPYHIYTAVLAKVTGRPVRYEANRKDSFYEQGHNYPLLATAKMGLKRDGTITALEGTSWVPSGGYGGRNNSDDWQSASRTYKIANVKVNGFSARTNTVRTSPLRCVGEPAGNIVTENLMNKAAEAIDMDPLEFRLMNIETEIDQVNGLPYSSSGLRESLERGAELFNWKERWQGWNQTTASAGDGPQRGIGMMAFECAKGSASPPMTAIVQVEADGSVVVNTGAADIGGGQATTWMMIVAETLGVPMEQMTIRATDNQAGPDALGIFGSRGTKSVGTGMLWAARDAKRQILEGAAFSLDLNAAELDIKEGQIFKIDDPDNEDFQMTFREAVGSGVVIVDDEPRPTRGTIVGEARAPGFSGYSQKTFGAGFFEVEVDPGTGFVRVIEAVQVHDVGRAINPQGVLNQIQGGMMHGINKALTEEMVYDPPTGALVNPNLDDYKLHMMDQLPEKVQMDYVEPFDVLGPYGAKGLGEPANIPPSPSIHAAIYDAVGVRVDKFPITPPRILNAIREI